MWKSGRAIDRPCFCFLDGELCQQLKLADIFTHLPPPFLPPLRGLRLLRHKLESLCVITVCSTFLVSHFSLLTPSPCFMWYTWDPGWQVYLSNWNFLHLRYVCCFRPCCLEYTGLDTSSAREEALFQSLSSAGSLSVSKSLLSMSTAISAWPPPSF